MVAVIGVGAQFQQRADEGQRAVINRVFQHDLADRGRAAAIGKIRWVAEAGLDRGQVAALIGLVQFYKVGHRAISQPTAFIALYCRDRRRRHCHGAVPHSNMPLRPWR